MTNEMIFYADLGKVTFSKTVANSEMVIQFESGRCHFRKINAST